MCILKILNRFYSKADRDIRYSFLLPLIFSSLSSVSIIFHVPSALISPISPSFYLITCLSSKSFMNFKLFPSSIEPFQSVTSFQVFFISMRTPLHISCSNFNTWLSIWHLFSESPQGLPCISEHCLTI